MINLYQSFKGEALSFGRAHAKKYVRQFLLVFLIAIAANIIAGSFSPWTDANGVEIVNIMSFISDGLWVLVSAILTVVTIQIYLDINEWKSVNFNHFKLNTRAKRRLIGKWIWGYILYSLIIIWGLILLIIPGIYFAIRLSFWEYYLIDQKMSVKDALRASWDKTNWHVWQLISIWFLSLGVMLLGTLALWIGLLRAIPTVKIAYAHLYKKLSA